MQRRTTIEAFAQKNGSTLARDVASLLDYPMDDVWWALCNVPICMAGLLESPEGWGTLAAYLAIELGMGAVDYLPSVH